MISPSDLGIMALVAAFAGAGGFFSMTAYLCRRRLREALSDAQHTERMQLRREMITATFIGGPWHRRRERVFPLEHHEARDVDLHGRYRRIAEYEYEDPAEDHLLAEVMAKRTAVEIAARRLIAGGEVVEGVPKGTLLIELRQAVHRLQDAETQHADYRARRYGRAVA